MFYLELEMIVLSIAQVNRTEVKPTRYALFSRGACITIRFDSELIFQLLVKAAVSGKFPIFISGPG